ncbi:c-type cytochrome [Aquifex sp.]
MKKLLLAGVFLAGTVFAADGKAIFQSKGCTSCHQPSVDTVGPSLKKIAQVYGNDVEGLVKFLKGEAQPKVDPPKFPIMKAQLTMLKGLSDAELKALAEFILSHK